jgi:hypothetical protein
MLYRSEMERDGTVRLHPHPDSDRATETIIHDVSHGYLSRISEAIEKLRVDLWPLNKYIHENPELAFEEHKAHEALTNFMQSYEGWRVTKSAYGISTAWEAVYDGGKAGPLVSFNAEMGKLVCRRSLRRWHRR